MPIPLVVTKRYEGQRVTSWLQPAIQTNRDPNRDEIHARPNQPRTSETYRRQDNVFGYKLQLVSTVIVWSAASISESELLIQAIEKTVWCAASISKSELQAIEKTVWCDASISESELLIQAIEKTVWCAASISESELQAIEKTVWCAASISESELQAIEKTVWCAASISESELQTTVSTVIVWSAASISESELLIQAIEKTVWCAARPTKSSRVIQKFSSSGRVTRRQVMQHFTGNGTDQCRNGSLNLLIPYREQPRSTRMVVAYPRPAFSATKRTNQAPISFDHQAQVSQGHTSCRNNEN